MADEGYGEDDAFFFDDDDYLYVEDDYAIAVSLPSALLSPTQARTSRPRQTRRTTGSWRWRWRSREAACRTYPS
jgi:hypothetical protein